MERLQRMASELSWLPRAEGTPQVVAWPGVPLLAGRVDNTFWLGNAPVTQAQLRILCLDHGPMGGFLLQRMAGEAVRSWPRRLYPAAALHGAWGLFLSDRLISADLFGAGEASEHRQRLAQALEAARLDLDIHLGAVSEAEGLKRLRQAGWDEEGAHDRLVEIVRRPVEALATVLGWRMLAALVGGNDEAEADRLQAVLRVGQAPLPLVVRNVFGSDAAVRLLEGKGL